MKPNALEGVATGVLRASLTGADPSRETREWLRRMDEGLSKAKAAVCEVPDTFAAKPRILPLIFLGLQVDTLGFIASTGSPMKTIAALQAYNAAKPETRIPRGQNLIDLGAQLMPPLLKELGATEETLPKAYEALALKLRQEMATLLDQAFASARVEVLVSLGGSHSELYATAGYPAITVPLGLGQDGTPNGVTLIGKPGKDADLLAYAYAFEQATPYRVSPAAVGP